MGGWLKCNETINFEVVPNQQSGNLVFFGSLLFGNLVGSPIFTMLESATIRLLPDLYFFLGHAGLLRALFCVLRFRRTRALYLPLCRAGVCWSCGLQIASRR